MKTTMGGFRMSRKYTRIQVLEANIYHMKEEGKTNREIAGELGLELRQIKNLINRHNHAKAANEEETMPRPKGRPRKDGQPPHPRQDTEIQRLRMENKLLRDFLLACGKR